ncbi:MAG: dephospho-CoA kinase [Bacteroidetes bacterium]|nr:MAG: dephospho-CoA kinase [Bacteroidota bacterium]
MKVVGITGGIGSGKTTVCKLFELLGIPVFYSDDEAKKLYDHSKIRSKVVKLFGKRVLDKNKGIDKNKLAAIVFSNGILLDKLNRIIHPQVQKQFIAWKKKQKGVEMVIKEAAIMIESGAYKEINYLISINSPKQLRINRLLYRNNISVSNIKKRMNEQISDKEREKYSDAIIVNDEKHSLIGQVLQLYKKLNRK